VAVSMHIVASCTLFTGLAAHFSLTHPDTLSLFPADGSESQRRQQVQLENLNQATPCLLWYFLLPPREQPGSFVIGPGPAVINTHTYFISATFLGNRTTVTAL
jgi:hypothetical protein